MGKEAIRPQIRTNGVETWRLTYVQCSTAHTRTRTHRIHLGLGLACYASFFPWGSTLEALSIAPTSLVMEHQDPETSANRITRMLNTSLSRAWRLLIG